MTFSFDSTILSQNTTLGGESDEKFSEATEAEKTKKHKILLIPFEPRLFMCEIGKSIASETKMTYNQMEYEFRKGLDFSIYTNLKNNFEVVSLMSDTLKYQKDLSFIYQSIGYSYDKVPQLNPEDEKYTYQEIKKSENSAKIKNGELQVEMNNDKRFMNTKLTNKELIAYLHKRYDTDVFLFVNQLDIKNVMAENYNMDNNSRYQREITIHYSLLDVTGKTLNAGIIAEKFSSTVNEPKKIIQESFGKATSLLSLRTNKVLYPQKKKAPVKEYIEKKVNSKLN